MTDFDEALAFAFPEGTYSKTIQGIREGIAAGDDITQGIPSLANPVGKDIRGLIRRAAVMNRLHELCEAGDLPFVAEFLPMPIGGWHWLEIRSGIFHGYLVRTADRETFPEDTPNQQDKRLSNQPDFFASSKVVPISGVAKACAWLRYGSNKNGAITHALWGMPSSTESGVWLAQRDIMQAVRDTVIDPETTKQKVFDPKKKMKIRDQVLDALDGLKKRRDSDSSADDNG
ncbi:hypothetical protein BMS3Bbin10_01383 [bacterium BMS3Bbin10]|nr:hypothetical protein BMS3Bbin10_01383 [bacterium BMS3Bbin10]